MVNNYIKQFYSYIIIFLGFTIMTISFISREKDFLILALILIPVAYLVVKTIYGLILLLDTYKVYHYHLTREYYVLLVLGYQIILMSLDNNPLYLIISLWIIIVGLLMYRFINIIIIITNFLGTIILSILLSKYFDYNIFIIILTYIISNIFLYPLMYVNNRIIYEKIKLIEKQN